MINFAVFVYYLGFVSWIPFAWLKASAAVPRFGVRLACYAALLVTAFTVVATIFYVFFFAVM